MRKVNQEKLSTPEHAGNRSGLTFRALVLGILGSMLLTASSLYVAMRLGALPWPTIFASIAAMSILKVLGHTHIHEINVAQTAMTAGAMIAGGLAFTLPGLWTQGEAPQLAGFFLPVLAVSFAGLFLGLLLTWFWRPMLLEREKLPFPIGMAAAQTIISGDEGGAKGKLMMVSLAASALFTLIRDWFGKIPAMLTYTLPGSLGLEIGIMVYPMAPAIGYMVGGVFAAVMFFGAILAYFLIIPLGLTWQIFADQTTAVAFKDTVGLGLMVGAGLGTLLRFFYGRLMGGRRPAHAADPAIVPGVMGPAALKVATPRRNGWIILTVIGSAGCCLLSGMSLPVSLFVLAGTFLMTLMSCLITGETGIDPMEIFGIIVMMGCSFLFKTRWETGLLVAAVVAVASGFAGDTMFDYRAGQILGTNPKEQLIAQAVGGIVGAVVASITLFVVIDQFGPVFTAALPAPQAGLVFSMVNQAFDPQVFWPAALVGALLCMAGLPATTLGIGMYLPIAFSAAIALGGLIRWIGDRFWPKYREEGLILSSGIFGGESLTGVLIAFLSFFTAL